jgi:hypothetical protein
MVAFLVYMNVLHSLDDFKAIYECIIRIIYCIKASFTL